MEFYAAFVPALPELRQWSVAYSGCKLQCYSGPLENCQLRAKHLDDIDIVGFCAFAPPGSLSIAALPHLHCGIRDEFCLEV